MIFGFKNFEIHITNEDPRQDTKVYAYPRRKKSTKIRKSKEGKDTKTSKIAIFSADNELINGIKNDDDVRQEILDFDKEIDIGLAGKMIGMTSTLLLNADNELCHNFTEYEIKKDREGNIITCEVCGEIHCEHNIKESSIANVNLDDKPVIWIKPMMIDKLEAIKRWSFDKSYQLKHTDGLTFNHLYKMAKKLDESNKLVLMAPIEKGKPQKLVIRTGGKPFLAWLEGRIRGNEYALILHKTTLKLGD